MSLGTAKDEIEWSNKIWGSTNIESLREQQEGDYGLWGPEEYDMNEDEPLKDKGEWDKVTTPSPKILANKVMGLLVASSRQLFIDTRTNETRKERAKLSKAEQLANGCIFKADRSLTSVPSGKDIQSALAFFAAVKGGVAISAYLSEDEDGLNSDLQVHDPEYCQWEEGDRELIKFCNRKYVSKAFLEKLLKKSGKASIEIPNPDSQGRILTYYFCDDETWKIACNGEYIVEIPHGLGYLPVFIQSCGFAPYTQSENYAGEALKQSWMSVFANTRDIYKLESKMLSIGSSMAKESGIIKIFGEVDSTKQGIGGANLSEQLEKAGYMKDNVGGRTQIIIADVARGEKLVSVIPPPSMENIERFYSIVRSADIIGSLDPIAFGQMTRSGSGALAAELRNAALEFLSPFRKVIERAFVWTAEECVRQFVNGNFSEADFEGRDSKKNKFYLQLSPGDVEEAIFDCNLVADRLRDEQAELGLAIQKIQYGLGAKKTVMTRHNLAEDPDREIDMINEEKADEDPVYVANELAKQFAKENNTEMALYYEAKATITIDATIRQAAQASPVFAQKVIARQGMPPPLNPMMGGGGNPDRAFVTGQRPVEEPAEVAQGGAV